MLTLTRDEVLHLIRAWSGHEGGYRHLLAEDWLAWERQHEADRREHEADRREIAALDYLVNGIDKARNELCNRIAGLERELVEARAEIARLTSWVNDLQSGQYINCVYCGHYCGHRYGPEGSTAATLKQAKCQTMAEALTRHIEQCPEHPMSGLKRELAEATHDRDINGQCHADCLAALQARENDLAEAKAEIEQLRSRGIVGGQFGVSDAPTTCPADKGAGK